MAEASAGCCAPSNAENRQQHICRKARHDFKQYRDETDPETVEFQVRLAETQLDNVAMQRQVLSQLAREGNLKGPR
jgi:hypothetical protein